MTWWMWMILGFILILVEFLTPGGFYIIFFGAAAIVVGLISLLGLAGPQWFEWLLFTAVSVAGIALFRKRLLMRIKLPQRPDDLDTVVGKVALVIEPIPPGSLGRVEMRGTAWTAKNLGPQPLSSGDRAKVEQVEGLVLGVRSDG
jgi:membrane protein implicated in regulation of membrane protease activity